MLLTGIFPALTTPFYPDGRLYLKKLEHNVDRYSRTPIAGMTILGSTGAVGRGAARRASGRGRGCCAGEGPAGWSGTRVGDQDRRSCRVRGKAELRCRVGAYAALLPSADEAGESAGLL